MWMQAVAQGSLILIALGGVAVAAPAERQIAEASFTSSDPTGCVTTEVFVFVKAGRTGGDGKLHLAVSQIDDCQDKVLLQGKAKKNLGAGEFSARPDLSSASLRTTVPVNDRQSGRTLELHVDLAWTGTEEAVSADALAVAEEPGKFERVRAAALRRTLRPTRATGAVAEGGKNFTPQPADDSSLELVLKGNPKG